MNKIDAIPTSIERDGDLGITIRWSDDLTSHWTTSQLRAACPCATCREKKRSLDSPNDQPASAPMLPVLSAAEAKPLRIDAMRPVGNYAYNISFSDGHSSGVFLFDLLRQPPK